MKRLIAILVFVSIGCSRLEANQSGINGPSEGSRLPAEVLQYFTSEKIISLFNKILGPQYTVPPNASVKIGSAKVDQQPFAGEDYSLIFVYTELTISVNDRAIQRPRVTAAIWWDPHPGNNRTHLLDQSISLNDGCDSDELKTYLSSTGGLQPIAGHRIILLDRKWAHIPCGGDTETHEWTETTLHAEDLSFKECYRFISSDLKQTFQTFPETDRGYVANLAYLNRVVANIGTVSTGSTSRIAPRDSLVVTEVRQDGICKPKITKKIFYLCWDPKAEKFKSEPIKPEPEGASK